MPATLHNPPWSCTSCAFKTSARWAVLTHYQVQLPTLDVEQSPHPQPFLVQQLLYANPVEILPERFHLNSTDHLLIVTDFSLPGEQHQLSRKEISFLGSSLLSVTDDSAAPADQKPD